MSFAGCDDFITDEGTADMIVQCDRVVAALLRSIRAR